LKIVTEKVHTLFLDIDNYQRPKISAIIFDLPRNKCWIVFVDVEVLDLYRQIDFQSMTALAQANKTNFALDIRLTQNLFCSPELMQSLTEKPGEQGQAATGFSQPLTE
jgi:hypothetical protein